MSYLIVATWILNHRYTEHSCNRQCHANLDKLQIHKNFGERCSVLDGIEHAEDEHTASTEVHKLCNTDHKLN